MTRHVNEVLFLRNHSFRSAVLGRALFVLESHPVIVGTFGGHDESAFAEILARIRPRILILDLEDRQTRHESSNVLTGIHADHNRTTPRWILDTIAPALATLAPSCAPRTVLIWREDQPPEPSAIHFESVIHGEDCESVSAILSALCPSRRPLIRPSLHTLTEDDVWHGVVHLPSPSFKSSERSLAALRLFAKALPVMSPRTFGERAAAAITKYAWPTVFLSHSSRDKKFVRNLAQFLQAKGIRVWVDEAEILVGDSLIEKLRSGLDAASHVLAVLSKNSVASRWVRKELDVAMNQEIEGHRVRVLPILLEDCELPGFLKGKVYADFRDPRKRKQARRGLLNSLINS